MLSNNVRPIAATVKPEASIDELRAEITAALERGERPAEGLVLKLVAADPIAAYMCERGADLAIDYLERSIRQKKAIGATVSVAAA
jgi:hypothetical protein